MSIQPAGAVPSWDLTDRLRKARQYAGLEQAELAERLGASRKTIGNAERGQHYPRRSLLMAWAMATGVDLEWLETGVAASNPTPPPGEYTPWDSNPEPSDSGPGRLVPFRLEHLDLAAAA